MRKGGIRTLRVINMRSGTRSGSFRSRIGYWTWSALEAQVTSCHPSYFLATFFFPPVNRLLYEQFKALFSSFSPPLSFLSLLLLLLLLIPYTNSWYWVPLISFFHCTKGQIMNVAKGWTLNFPADSILSFFLLLLVSFSLSHTSKSNTHT